MRLNILKHNEQQDQIFTEGEEFIKDFLESEGIKYEFQKIIPKLASDIKAYRQADFYLPKYDIYIEFLGSWNTSEQKRDAYRKKMAIYELNNINCIYIFPDNLGIIHYIFNKRIRSTLDKYKRHRKLFKFNLSQFLKYDGGLLFWIAFMILLIFLNLFDEKPGINWKWILGCFIVLFYLFYCVVNSIKKFFKSGYSYVDFFH